MMAFRLLGVVGFLTLATPVFADPVRIFESGTPGPNGQMDGYLLGVEGFTGLRFFVPAPVVTTRIGGHFAGYEGELFGALVALADANDLPDSQNLSTSDVLGGTAIVLPPRHAGSRILHAPLAVSLQEGWYAIVFGSGLFGASGTGVFVFGNEPAGQSIIGSGGLTRPNVPFLSGVLGQGRLYAFVDAEPAPVPEPTTMLLLGTGVAAIAMRRRRRRFRELDGS